MMQINIMLICIMLFLNRKLEWAALDAARRRRDGALVVVSGRRRVGKTRLLIEWVRREGGVYFVADESSPALQRRYFAETLARRLPAFADVEYRDWRGLLSRLAVEAKRLRFTGPLVIDELPYLVASSPELPSVLQQWIDHEAREARLTVALAGSSQTMMQGLVLDANAPLFGRAHAHLDLQPLSLHWLSRAFPRWRGFELLTAWSALGGVPRYWELAAELRGTAEECIIALALDPLGPLHAEPDRLLREEAVSAAELRPLLDAIGGGAHRPSEIAGRIGRQVTAMSRSFERLQGLGLVRREVPFGVPSKDTKRSLYRIVDPFLNLWFRVVAPNRAVLALATAAERRRVLEHHLPALVGAAFEELARASVPKLGGWEPASRWWQGSLPEWDVVSRDGSRLLVGEARAWRKPATATALRAEIQRMLARPLPVGLATDSVERVFFVPMLARGVPRRLDGVRLVTLDELVRVAA
ncbi:MAG: ATP-binding protein [Archangium sp.]